jgi:hypothetical protein
MVKTLFFLDMPFQESISIQNLMRHNLLLSVAALLIFIYSGYKYFKGKAEEENAFEAYKYAYSGAFCILILGLIGYLSLDHYEDAFIQAWFIGIGLYVFEKYGSQWEIYEMTHYAIPIHAEYLWGRVEQDSWDYEQKRYKKAQMACTYTYNGYKYLNDIIVPIDIYITSQAADKLLFNISSRYPRLHQFEKQLRTELVIIPEKLAESRLYITPSV